MAAREETPAGTAPEFDPALHISPFALFRRLREGDAPLLVDVRPRQPRREALSLAGAVVWGEQARAGTRAPDQLRAGTRAPDQFQAAVHSAPPAERDVVLFDDDGGEALARTRDLRAAGWPRVRALYGGLALYEFALDPAVVGEERFLRRAGRG